MIGIVVVSHGRLADEFVAATEHVVGKQKQLKAICIAPEDDMDQRRQDIVAAVEEVEGGHGVAILTDMFGGTPSNLAISVMGKPGIEVVAGINLPMMVKLVSIRGTMPLHEAVLAAQEAGRKYINVASNLLARDSAA
jgi:PTS system mannose-specific IIA component